MFSPTTEAIIKETGKDTYAFLKVLRKDKILSSYIPSQLPVVSLVNGTVKVYDNIQFDPKKIKRSIRLDAAVFKPTLNLLKASSRVTVRSLERVQYIKYTTFLNKYLGLRKNSSLKDSEIRDLANKLLHTLQTNSTELVVCKTLQDHFDLYTKVHALSCMSPKTYYSEYRTDLKTYLYKKHGLWPSMWYYYNPHTRGVVLRVKGRRVARTILLRSNAKGKFTKYYNTIYAESNFYQRLFAEILQSKGITPSWKISIATVFKVPAIEVFKEPICPLPFSDCINNGYRCFYNKKENAFYFGPNDKLPTESVHIYSPYGFNGYIDSRYHPAHEHISVRSTVHAK